MQATGQTVALRPHETHTVWGFTAPPGQGDRGSGGPSCPGAQPASRAAQSLLSEMLKDMVAAVPCSDTCSAMSEDWSDGEDGDPFFEEEMDAVLGSSYGWRSADGSGMDQSDKSSTCSQPIPIPASTYYKDEMQRAALEKLNQKRKWYQQQMETERLANKNLASKGRPLQACAPTAAKHHKHNSRLVS